MLKFLKTSLPPLLLASLLLISSCSGSNSRSGAAETDKLSVAVSFDALYELARVIGGDRVSIVKIIPDGSEPHDFEPKAKDLTLLSTADVFIINGLGLEPWSDDAVAAAKNDALRVVDASEGIAPIALSDDDDNNDDDHEHSSYDPHVWLSLDCAAVMARNIRDAFASADPDWTGYYNDNCDAFTRRLDALFDEYDAKFSALERKTIVTGHAVFAYLCRDFGLEQNSVTGAFNEGEPSAKKLAELVEYCRDNGVATVLAERGTSSQVSDTLAREAGASVAAIYTLESAEDGLSYIERMEKNLALICDGLR